jgi:hypothetical protein
VHDDDAVGVRDRRKREPEALAVALEEVDV